MPATNRTEKHRGFTLIVTEGSWLDLVKDGTGLQVSGPVTCDRDVVIFASKAIPFLRQLELELAL